MNISRAYPPTFSGAGQGAYQELDPETREILEALITKTPQGLAQTSLETAQFLKDLQRGAELTQYPPNTPQFESQLRGRQTYAGLMDLPETLPKAAKAISEDVSGTVSALGTGLKEAVKERGLGAIAGFEDVIPFAKLLKLLGAGGAAVSMAGPVMGMGKQTRERLLKEIAEAGTQAQANKIARPAIEEYGYDPEVVDAVREKRDKSIFEKTEGLAKGGKENPAAIRREKMRGNPEFKRRLPQDVKGETIATPLDISQREIVQPESMVGNAAIGVPGDRSARTRIEQLGGVKLAEPIDVQGGPTYGFGRDDFSWASNYGIARGKQNHVITASEATGLPVLGVYTAMGEGAVDFSTPVVELLMGQLNTIRVPAAARKKLDQKINEAIQTVNKQRIVEGVKKGRPTEVIEDSLLDDFLGIDHPEAMAQLLGIAGPSGKEYRRLGSGDLRKVVVQTIAREDMRGLGFPSYKDAAYQMTEPELRSVQRGDTGGAVLRMDPDATLRDPSAPPDAGHRSYDTGIPGQYQGVMEQVDIPAPIMFPKTFDKYRTLKTKEGNPMELHSQMGKFHMGADFEVLDQQWLDGVRGYMERKGITDMGGVPTLAFLLLGAGGLNAMASDDPEMQAAGGAMMGAAAMGGAPKFIKQAATGARNAKKLREQKLKEFEDFDYPDAEESIRTQITTTKPTYIKANQYLDDQQAVGKTLDYGAGLGFSKEMLGYDMFEPNTARGEALGVTYDYTDSKVIPDNQYERVVNLNVLNVVSPQVRDFIVEDIGRVMRPGGSAIITTRGRDVLNAKGTPGPEPMSLVTSTGTYQKGFTNPELKEYIETVLGEGYDVKSITLGAAGVYVKKKGNQPMTARGARSAELAAEQAQTGAIAGMGRPVGQATEAELVQQIEDNKQIFKDNFEKKKAGIITEEEWKSLLQPLREKDKYLRAQATAAKGREFGAGQAYDTLDEVEKARMDRAVEQGFNIDAFHGTKGDIESFDPGLLGATTDAPSARVGYFFSADPKTASNYAMIADIATLRPKTANRIDYLESELTKMADEFRRVEKTKGIAHTDPDFPDKRERLSSELHQLRESGKNIMPVKLRLTNPLEYDFQGKGYREVTYRDLLEQARMAGNDGAIFRNTRDGGGTTDIYVVFDPAQIRSRFATFDPESAPKTVTPDDIDKQKRIVASLERAVQKTDAENVRLNMEWEELSNEAYSKPNISEQEGNKLAELSAEIQRNDDYVQYLIGEIANVKAQANVRTEGTGDLLASVAPVLYPVGAGAAAAAYTANNE
tara:strand:+ start:13949 stop:17773 length:3825 start_codon:yes stop_codon:yes gene_type:complete